MVSLRPMVSVLLVSFVVFGCGGCKKDESATAKPEPTSSATPKGKLNLRTPLQPTAKVDPQAMKEYRVELCEYGTLTLRYARDTYLASLGKDEPSEKKLPNFGSTGETKPPTGASAAPKTSGAPSARAPGAPPDLKDRRPFDITLRVSHERNARACNVALGLKEPPMGDVDTALATFAPFAVDLAKDIATASNYYQREEYKKDSFAKGKELHKKMVGEFPKYDELHDKLAAAFAAWRKDHPADQAKMDEGEKVAYGAFEEARGVLEALVPKKPDKEAFKANLAKLEKSNEALKTYGKDHAQDVWSKIMNPSFDAFLKSAKDGEAKVTDKGVDGETFLNVVNNFYSLIEARNRALQRALVTKQQAAASGAPAAPPAPPAPPGQPE